jgi:hypothetical protein
MDKKYTVQISDHTGHTELLAQTLEQTVSVVMETAAKHSQWVWINGEPFMFEEGEINSKANVKKLSDRLQASNNETTVVMSGTLVGGLV